MVFIVSQLEYSDVADDGFVADDEMELKVKVLHAEGVKCERCWKYSTEIDSETSLCPRCAKVLK